MDKYFEAIEKSGNRAAWSNGYPGQGWKHARTETVELMDKKRGYRLYGADSWKKYSRKVSYPIHLRYLCGYSDNQYWCIRVSPSIDNISEALDWIKPAPVKNAEKAGKKIFRQGDFYFIPQRAWNLTDLRRTHHEVWYQIKNSYAFVEYTYDYNLNGNRVIIAHHEHKNLTLETPYKAIQQKDVFGKKNPID